jgi:predicted transposase/invertase (TIGR01784 family)
MSTLLKSELDWQSRETNARRKGLMEGFIKGHDEARLDIAQKMKNAGRPLSEITEFTGLPIETITQL